MSATDGSRLTYLGDRWLDLDDVVSVRVEDAGLGRGMAAQLGLRNGESHIVPIPSTNTEGWPRVTHQEARDEVNLWLLNHLGEILEGIGYGKASS